MIERYSELINNYYRNGKLNKFFYNKLIESLDANNEIYMHYSINSAIALSEIGISSFDSYIKYTNLKKILKESSINLSDNIAIDVLKRLNSYNIKNINDYYYIILEAVLDNKKITKKSYPLYMGALSEDPPEERNLSSWGALVNKIYRAVASGDMTFKNAVDYYSVELDSSNGEDYQFKRWIEYHESGDGSKYAKDNAPDGIEKFGGYPVDLIGGPYYADSREFNYESEVSDAREKESLKSGYTAWKKRLNSALRKIDLLMRKSEGYCTPEDYEQIVMQLHQLDIKVNQLRLASTAADLTYKTASRIKKMGFDNAANILYKIAQEAPMQDVAPEVAPEAATEAAPLAGAVSENTQQEDLPGEEKKDPFADVESVPLSDIEPVPGPYPGEYDILAGDVTLDDAAGKLEEVAGMLADRRVIRLLAEFDILLDKLSLATMFPELAESQAKLIDSYGYALTRVTRMLGMLANTGALVDAVREKETPTSRAGEAGEVEGGAIANELSPGAEEAVAPPETEGAVAPPETEGAVAPPETEGAVAPPETEMI